MNGGAAGLANFVDGADVRVIQRGGVAGFTQEPGARDGIVGVARR